MKMNSKFAFTSFVTWMLHIDPNVSAATSSWADTLATSLSTGASLHLVNTNNYKKECTTLGTNAYAISAGGHGTCMQIYSCAHSFCLNEDDFNLPLYVADVRTESDIQKVILAASAQNKTVSVKSTGHSYTGSSTFQDSLMVWMHNYPKNGTIQQNYTDSCGTVYDATVSVNGGEVWDDVLNAVGEKYHVVTGGARTVGAIGGWLQGGGMSFTSRQYGYGVDNVVDMRVVLANGTVVVADHCTNSDLFWALRGGGGGTYGVVTNAHYKLYPVTPVLLLQWGILGIDEAVKRNLGPAVYNAIYQWITYWVKVSPTLDSRWAGGYFHGTGLHIVFLGSLEEAQNTFLNDFQNWYDNTLDKSAFIANVWGAYPPNSVFSTKSYDSWYEYKGGAADSGKPDKTDATGDAYAIITDLRARLMPLSVVQEKPEQVVNLLMDLIVKQHLCPLSYFLGGNMLNYSDDATSIHPANRKAVWSLYTFNSNSSQNVRDFIPNNVTGVDYNHHNVLEPDWRNACWGPHYKRLLEIKQLYDPNNLFKCWHCVGYFGEETPSISVAHVASYLTAQSLIIASATVILFFVGF